MQSSRLPPSSRATVTTQTAYRAKDKIDEKKLSSWKLLDDFRRRLANAQATVPVRDKRPGGPVRLLLEEDYCSLMLFGLFNPVLDSMRGLCAASHLKRVQQDVCSRPVSLGSFSEAQGVFDPELLKQVFLKLAGEIPTSWGDALIFIHKSQAPSWGPAIHPRSGGICPPCP